MPFSRKRSILQKTQVLNIMYSNKTIMYSNKTIIQIGSHIGNTVNDPIYTNIDKTTTLILVEPVPYLFEQLKQNYKNRNINKIFFINKAVSNFIGEIELTIPSQQNDFSKLPFWASQLASVNTEHAQTHIENLITEKITVKTTTIDEIIKDYNIKEIELLHTDTEGHDYEIIMNYSFNIKPCSILFEYKHMDGVFTVGKKYEMLMNKLNSLGYKFKYKNDEDTMVELLQPVDIICDNNRTMVSKKILTYLSEWVLKFSKTNYSFIECGIAKGGCIAIMKFFSGHGNKIYGFDAFEGMPNLTKEDEGSGQNWVGYNCSNGIKSVSDTFNLLNINFKDVYIIKGYFEETIPMYLDNIENIAILRLDNDWYQSTKYCLNSLYGKVIKGGVVLIDDYGIFTGCKKAVDEFRQENNITSPLIAYEKNSEWFWIK